MRLRTRVSANGLGGADVVWCRGNRVLGAVIKKVVVWDGESARNLCGGTVEGFKKLSRGVDKVLQKQSFWAGRRVSGKWGLWGSWHVLEVRAEAEHPDGVLVKQVPSSSFLCPECDEAGGMCILISHFWARPASCSLCFTVVAEVRVHWVVHSIAI